MAPGNKWARMACRVVNEKLDSEAVRRDSGSFTVTLEKNPLEWIIAASAAAQERKRIISYLEEVAHEQEEVARNIGSDWAAKSADFLFQLIDELKGPQA